MNTFGDSTQQFGLFDPRAVRENRMRFRRDAIKLLERANSFYCPSGRWPSRGWILMARSEYNKLNPYSTSLQLNIDSAMTLKNISVVQAQCVTRGLATDANALYLIEITDDRGILFNEWFQAPTTSFYNIRSPGHPETFYASSMNGGVPWTWSTMLQDMWNQINAVDGGSILGNWPGLPTIPVGTPEGFWFPGVAIWPAFNDVLEHLGMTVVCNLTGDNPFTIVVSGMTDAIFTALQTKYVTNLEDDLEWIDTGAGRVPATIEVLFRRRNNVCDSFQWNVLPAYMVSVTAPATFTSAVGSHYIWSDFTLEFDQDDNPLATDVATANAVAQERVSQYFAKVYRQTAGYMTQTYAGALPFVTGSQVDGVCYRQDYSDQARQGWKTEIVRGAYPPWPEYTDSAGYGISSVIPPIGYYQQIPGLKSTDLSVETAPDYVIGYKNGCLVKIALGTC